MPDTYAPCQAFSEQSNKCTNGFPTNRGCWQKDNFLPTTPFCCREEWAGRFYESSGGKPRPVMEE